MHQTLWKLALYEKKRKKQKQNKNKNKQKKKQDLLNEFDLEVKCHTLMQEIWKQNKTYNSSKKQQQVLAWFTIFVHEFLVTDKKSLKPIP